ncbi:MAG TPA: hypothetical protein VJ720_00765 [Chitinophaga sp.]|nr:hypothetical protein [Chitinophaga sp.]
MRHYKLFVIGLLLMAACKKADYLTDGGVHDPKTPLSVHEYLEQHPYKMFDSVLTIIDHYQLQEELDQTGTVFAPTDYSVREYMLLRRTEKRMKDENAVYTMDSLFSELTADSVRQYLFSEKLPVSGFKDEQPHLYDNAAGISCAVKKELHTGDGVNEWSSYPVYYLYYIKIRGDLDIPGVTPPPGEEDISVLCQTTGIETKSGGGPFLHVLNNRHVFARF